MSNVEGKAYPNRHLYLPRTGRMSFIQEKEVPSDRRFCMRLYVDMQKMFNTGLLHDKDSEGFRNPKEAETYDRNIDKLELDYRDDNHKKEIMSESGISDEDLEYFMNMLIFRSRDDQVIRYEDMIRLDQEIFINSLISMIRVEGNPEWTGITNQ